MMSYISFTFKSSLFRYTTGDKFYVQPLGQENSDNRILEIDRVTQELTLKGNTWWGKLIQMFNLWAYVITFFIYDENSLYQIKSWECKRILSFLNIKLEFLKIEMSKNWKQIIQNKLWITKALLKRSNLISRIKNFFIFEVKWN